MQSVRRAALRRLGLTRSRAQTALVVPVPAASDLITRLLPPRQATVARLAPHVTLLYPFVPAAMIDHSVESTLEEVVARFPAFRFQLSRVARFPGVLYVEPDPASSFLTLIETLLVRWPDHPPYGGRYDTVVPHLTVLAGREPLGLAAALEEALPVDCKAERTWLMVQDDGGLWQVKRDVLFAGP